MHLVSSSSAQTMFASLKNKIREETGSDLTKITSSWRSGAFLSRTQLKDEPTTSSSSSGACGDSASDSISPKLENYLEDRASGTLLPSQLEERLRERDAAWEKRLEQQHTALVAAQEEEATAAAAVARAAAAEAAAAAAERDEARRQLQEMRDAAAAAARAQDRLDHLTEELELSRREWSRERAESRAALDEAEARATEIAAELAIVKASLPPGHPYHLFEDEDSIVEWKGDKEALAERCRREQAVLRRQLQEARLALADVKTSWSGQIASLETQVARLSLQAGEESAERRRTERDNAALCEELLLAQQHMDKLKQHLANSEAKGSRLGAEVSALSAELRAARAGAAAATERVSELESRLAEVVEENAELRQELAAEREAVRGLQESEERGRRACVEREREAGELGALVAALQRECSAIQRRYDKEKMEKDEALVRNAQISQSMELRQCEAREQAEEAAECRARLAGLEALVARHRENQAECMLIQEQEASRVRELELLRVRVQELTDSGLSLRNTVEQLETQLAEKNKRMRTLDTRIADMKRTLQRELSAAAGGGGGEEEAEISRRYLKHVVLRFVTAREEARQLTRALAALLRLSAQEEAALQAALPAPAPTSLAGWFASLAPT